MRVPLARTAARPTVLACSYNIRTLAPVVGILTRRRVFQIRFIDTAPFADPVNLDGDFGPVRSTTPHA